MKILLQVLPIVLLMATSCKESSPQNQESTDDKLGFSEPPEWSRSAIWYQIFVERFRNGDHANDPRLEDVAISLMDDYPPSWQVTDWGHNWYDQEEWATTTGLDFYRTIQMRRYGGDIQGVLDKIDYLKTLGVNAIYFNPLNDAPSLHKFDARNYHHVDVNFGPNPLLDKEKIKQESPNDAETWTITSADSLFFTLVNKLHDNGIKVVVDFSWNHTGRAFWAFEDIVKNQEKSTYKDWYEITTYDNPTSEEDEFEYEGWIGIKSLPELKKIRKSKKIPGHPFEGDIETGPKAHIFDVAKKWMDPNNDGDPSDGIDGMRLDVAEHVPLGFWRDFRKHVRSINPDFYLVGENWWTSWPDTLMDPVPWVQGDIFDAVMHYQWYKPMRYWITDSPQRLTTKEIQTELNRLYSSYRPQTAQAMMNLGASHDTPRLATSMANTNKYKYNSNPRSDSRYYIGKPTESLYDYTKMLMVQQFTWVGSPHIWMGDEMGMWGADDPDNRKPLLWDDISFEKETPYESSDYKYDEVPKPSPIITSLYQSLAEIRKQSQELISTDYNFVDIHQDVLAYTRGVDNNFMIIINRNKSAIEFERAGWEIILSTKKMEDNSIPPTSAHILKKKNQ